jgi:hypothetical protein
MRKIASSVLWPFSSSCAQGYASTRLPEDRFSVHIKPILSHPGESQANPDGRNPIPTPHPRSENPPSIITQHMQFSSRHFHRGSSIAAPPSALGYRPSTRAPQAGTLSTSVAVVGHGRALVVKTAGGARSKRYTTTAPPILPTTPRVPHQSYRGANRCAWIESSLQAITCLEAQQSTLQDRTNRKPARRRGCTIPSTNYRWTRLPGLA